MAASSSGRALTAINAPTGAMPLSGRGPGFLTGSRRDRGHRPVSTASPMQSGFGWHHRFQAGRPGSRAPSDRAHGGRSSCPRSRGVEAGEAPDMPGHRKRLETAVTVGRRLGPDRAIAGPAPSWPCWHCGGWSPAPGAPRPSRSRMMVPLRVRRRLPCALLHARQAPSIAATVIGHPRTGPPLRDRGKLGHLPRHPLRSARHTALLCFDCAPHTQ